jgi:uncharacterized membrane protein YfhO
MSEIFHRSFSMIFSMRRSMTAFMFLSVHDTLEKMAMLTFAFVFATRPLVLLCLGRGGFCFALLHGTFVPGRSLASFPPT